jgi:hypothetical protein
MQLSRNECWEDILQHLESINSADPTTLHIADLFGTISELKPDTCRAHKSLWDTRPRHEAASLAIKKRTIPTDQCNEENFSIMPFYLGVLYCPIMSYHDFLRGKEGDLILMTIKDSNTGPSPPRLTSVVHHWFLMILRGPAMLICWSPASLSTSSAALGCRCAPRSLRRTFGGRTVSGGWCWSNL